MILRLSVRLLTLKCVVTVDTILRPSVDTKARRAHTRARPCPSTLKRVSTALKRCTASLRRSREIETNCRPPPPCPKPTYAYTCNRRPPPPCPPERRIDPGGDRAHRSIADCTDTATIDLLDLRQPAAHHPKVRHPRRAPARASSTAPHHANCCRTRNDWIH